MICPLLALAGFFLGGTIGFLLASLMAMAGSEDHDHGGFH